MACLGSRQHNRLGFVPRYKRRVKGIYPADKQKDTPDENGLDRLLYFIYQEPHKLEDVGKYLTIKISKHLSQQKVEKSKIELAALEAILGCEDLVFSPLFVESFLNCLQLFFESSNAEFWIWATTLFVQFSYLRADMSICKRYPYFEEKFNSMCLTKSKTNERSSLLETVNVRMDGLRGIEGLVMGTLGNDMYCNIWSGSSVILPALLENISPDVKLCVCSLNVGLSPQPSGSRISLLSLDRVTVSSVKPEIVNLNKLSASILNKMVGKAQSEHIKIVVDSVFGYIESQRMWNTNPEQAKQCVRLVQNAIAPQFKYILVVQLTVVLGANKASDTKKRFAMVQTLIQCIETVGYLSSLLYLREVLNTLLTQLRASKTSSKRRLEIHNISDVDASMEGELQKKLLDAIPYLISLSSDYQKTEIILILSEHMSDTSNSEILILEVNDQQNKPTQIQAWLLRIMIDTASQIKALTFDKILSIRLLDTLGNLLQKENIRLDALKLIQTLFDRHGNLGKLGTPQISKWSNLTLNMPSTSYFNSTHNLAVYTHLLMLLCELTKLSDNDRDIYVAIITCILLGSIEMMAAKGRALTGLIRSSLTIQNISTTSSNLMPLQVCQLHATVATLMHFIFELYKEDEFKNLKKYVSDVIHARQKHRQNWLPEAVLSKDKKLDQEKIKRQIDDTVLQECFFNAEAIRSSLPDYELLSIDVAYAKPDQFRPSAGATPPENSQTNDSYDSKYLDPTRRPSDLDAESFSSDLDFPAADRNVKFENIPDTLPPELTFSAMKAILTSKTDEVVQQNILKDQYKEVYEFYMTATWDEIKNRTKQNDDLTEKMDELLGRLAADDTESDHKIFPMTPRAKFFWEDDDKIKDKVVSEIRVSYPISMMYDAEMPPNIEAELY